MQAAAAQAGLATKLVSSSMNNRMQSATSSIQSAAHRTLSPTMTHPISPIMMQHNPHQQYIRSHRNRHVHPAQQHHRADNLGPIVGRQSRKGAHVLEPAHGDIILKRRTPSQKAVNDDDYTITAMSSMALTASQGHHHRHHHQTSVSRSRHRQEMVHDKRTSNHHENVHKKHQQKQKEPRTSSSTKTSTRRRWLKGHKETPNETLTENTKQDISATKSKKNTKNKKKNNEQEKVELTKKSTSPIPKGKTPSSADNNGVYGVPNTIINEQSKFETTSSQLPSPIEEENESDREEKNIGNKKKHMSPKEEDITQSKECNTTVERRPSKAKYYQKISSTDGEILSKVDDDTRFVYKASRGKYSFRLKKFLDFLVLRMIMLIVLNLMMKMTNVKVKAIFLSKNHLQQLIILINNNQQMLFNVNQVNVQLMNIHLIDVGNGQKKVAD